MNVTNSTNTSMFKSSNHLQLNFENTQKKGKIAESKYILLNPFALKNGK